MIYFIDHDADNRRTWEDLGRDLVAAQLTGGGLLCAGGNAILEGLIVAHRSAVIGPNGINHLADSVVSKPRLVVVVIHGGFQTEGDSIHSQIYCRRWPVDNPIDASFKHCWQRFVEAFTAGTVAFNLLEPEDTPYLTSLAILASAELTFLKQPATLALRRDRQPSFERWVSQVFDAKTAEELSERLRNDMPSSAAEEIVEMICNDRPNEVRQALDDFFV